MRSLWRCVAGAAAFLVLAVLCQGIASAQGVTVFLNPVSQTVSANSPFQIDLAISGLNTGATPALGAFDISVNFDSSLLSFQSANFGDPMLGDQLDLGNLRLNGASATAGTGTVDVIETDLFDSLATLLNSQAHSFILAELSFSTLTAGSSPVTVTLNSLADQNGAAFSASAQNANVVVQTSAVPEPSSFALIMAGMVGIFAAGARSKSRLL